MPQESFTHQRHLENNPTLKRGMIDGDASLSHHILCIVQAQGISQIPADTLAIISAG